MGKDRVEIKSQSDPGLHGRVSGSAGDQTHFDRQEEIADHVLGPGRPLQTPKTDWYGGDDDMVSIERAAETQLGMQERLDQHVVDENRGISHHDSRGLQPCQRVRRGDS